VHLDLNTCVLAVAAELLSMLRVDGVVRYPEICEEIEKRYGAQGKVQLPLALSLLYLLGLAEYEDGADAISLMQLPEGRKPCG
jgi:hypothetical protein